MKRILMVDEIQLMIEEIYAVLHEKRRKIKERDYKNESEYLLIKSAIITLKNKINHLTFCKITLNNYI